MTPRKRKKPRRQVRLDRMMRLLFRLSHKTVVRLINGLFDEAFDPADVKLVYEDAKLVSPVLSQLEADFLVTVRTLAAGQEYHVEFQTLPDSTMAVRMFQYGFSRALGSGKGLAETDERELESDAREQTEAEQKQVLTLVFPRQLVIYLEEHSFVGDMVELRLVFPDGQSMHYRVPTLRYWLLPPDELARRQLYALLPLQVFRWRKQLQALERSRLPRKEKERRIAAAFQGLKETMGQTLEQLRLLHEEQEIEAGDLEQLLHVMQELGGHLYQAYGLYEQLDREVRDMLKPWIDPKMKRQARREGWAEGKAEGKLEGKVEGKVEVATKLLHRGIMTLPEISDVTGLSLEQVSQLQEERKATAK
ncbi:hypothetical protein [Paenibacillus sp. YN15]|uniref:hypothetical protein n=1 Tax=Paenibacillus sp. YN15 TaxID=1742774 RepID=UPI000DCE5E95|nr:hypothetical protein [Paenibacillus sp. YN15]RAV00997.1 hypothetical protein DQG13_13440 [Paenibacillus sp. YN15]